MVSRSPNPSDACAGLTASGLMSGGNPARALRDERRAREGQASSAAASEVRNHQTLAGNRMSRGRGEPTGYERNKQDR
jgi:hypothetical protein